MKIRDYLFFAVILAVLLALYFRFGDRLKSHVFKRMDSAVKAQVTPDNLIFVSDFFTMTDYNTLVNKLSGAQNSIVLFLPQIFNMKIEPYMDDVEPEDIILLKQEYKDFVVKIADTPSIIPVAFVADGKSDGQVPGMTGFSYFKNYSGALKFHDYDYIKIKSLKVWQGVRTTGFFPEYRYYPYKVPLVFRHKGELYAGAAVEAVRKYYKLNRTQLSVDGRTLRIGSVVSAPLSENGDMIISGRAQRAPLTAAQVLELSAKKLSDKIIIINSLNNKKANDVNMRSLGAAVSALMTGSYIKYSTVSDYAGAAVLTLVLAAVFAGAPFLAGILLLLITQACVVAAAFILLGKNIYVDSVLLSACAFFAFFTVYYFKLVRAGRDTEKRRDFLHNIAPRESVSGLIASNKDIKIKNTWTECFAAYFMFDERFLSDMTHAQNAFENIKDIIYTFDRDFLMYYGGHDELMLMFPGKDRDSKVLLDALMAARDSQQLRDYGFNIFLTKTQVNLFELKKRPAAMDKDHGKVRSAHAVEKLKYILVSEADIQDYINYIKFQKVPGADPHTVFFNVAGHREGANT